MGSRRFVFASLVLMGSSACGGEPGESSGSTDSGGATETTTSSTTLTTTSSTTDSESDATTATPTSTSTTTSTSEPGTTEAPTSTSTTTTGDPFLCEADMDGCCEVDLEVEADTFFADAIDGVTGDCPVMDVPPPDVAALECELVSFGAAPEVRLIREDGNLSAVVGHSMMVLRFPSADGALLLGDEPIPNELIQAAHLELSAEVEWAQFDDLQFGVYGLDGDATWLEDQGDGATACVDGLASFACLECGPDVGQACATVWPETPGTTSPLGFVDGLQGLDSGLLPIDLAPLGSASDWVPAIADGLVIAPNSSVFMGQSLPDLVPYPGLLVRARESFAPPRLRLRLCLP